MGQYRRSGRLGASQNVAYTTVAGTITSGVGVGTTKVRVTTTTVSFIVIGKDPTATAAGVYMPADFTEYFTISPGEKVSAIRSSVNGTLHVTEIV